MRAWTTAQEGQHTPYLKKPNNRITGTFSTLNSYSGRLFLPIPPERVL
jgi:hypothetical protein